MSNETINLGTAKSTTGSVASVNVSVEKGTIKKPVDSVKVDRHGLVDDAHAGPWHRQVSLLGTDSVERFSQQAGRQIAPGEFAENLTVAGIDFQRIGLLDRFVVGEGDDQVELETTQIGKKCHGDSCAIYREVGACVMPHEGLFTRVIRGGTIRQGDPVEYLPFTLRADVLTLSDRAAAGDYEDRSGPAICATLAEFFAARRWRADIQTDILPDEADRLTDRVRRATAARSSLIITTGGTGIGPRDITPEVVRPMMDKEIPGIVEAIRIKYGEKKPGAWLSRSVAGVIGGTLVFCLPGSVRAVGEYMTEINRVLEHLLFMIRGIDRHG